MSHFQSDKFRIEPLVRDHDRAAFSCGVAALDRYLREQASQDARNRAAAPFVLLTTTDRIAGYYTLSAANILGNALSPETIRALKWPRYPELPATLIGRLARDNAFRGKGIGELLLMDALKRAAQSEIASLAVIVDIKDEQARRFYDKYGFLSFPDTENRLFLPMKTVEKLFRAQSCAAVRIPGSWKERLNDLGKPDIRNVMLYHSSRRWRRVNSPR